MERDIPNLLQTIVKPLVQDTDQVRVEVKTSPDCLTYDLYLSVADAGRIIGKQGRVAQAIRTIIYSQNRDNQSRIKLNIIPQAEA
ncbi:KH domain-containing protein [Lactobacillus sp. DCY120]|uniref:RNA-binding protein KhpA n=1 Tax=Bombilactobacillus apium TaxID=2675299 RepID=A0A850R809_9LACO|nr:KH domain-containing protein [Bombilactobacillus apium]NVY96987.1 KH domain-containing protein [Bombilactobacillus apium]